MTEYYRGHEIINKNDVYYFKDGQKVSDNKNIQCGFCNLPNRDDGHDACIGELEGVMNACCGHGDKRIAYIQYKDGLIVQKDQALNIINLIK